MRLRTCIILLSILVLTSAVSAQTALQRPDEFLGYQLGSRFTSHHLVVDYFKHVASNSDRVQVAQYGKTYEGRPLMVAFVSSVPNMERLQEIRTDNLRLAHLAEGELVGEPVSIVWLSYNVHGNESSGTEASMATLYALADPENESSAEWLENTVVLLDPAINPDGRDRYANWYNMVAGREMNVSSDAVEHAEPWPGGRTNHYYFDLNRDWSWQTQTETTQRMALYKNWMPHIHVDFHEQGVNNPYYFAPAAEPIHEDVTKWQHEFQKLIGLNHARYFDREGWLYFTKQSFDILYPGYGDSFPMFNGAIGMTYEQAGSGAAGLGILTVEGDTLSLLDRLSHHLITSLSTVEMASVHSDRVIEEFRAYFNSALNSPPGQYKAYVMKSSTPGNRIGDLVGYLDKLGILYGRVAKDERVEGYDYRSAKQGRQKISAGDLVVPMSQPRAVLTKVLFDPMTSLSDSLTYDITAWALPYAYDLDAVAVVAPVVYEEWKPTLAVSKNYSDRPYAYASRWDDAGDAAFLASLLRAKIRVRYASKPFSIHGQYFSEGTLIITRSSNEKRDPSFHTRVAEIAKKHNQALTGLATGFVDSGSDLGSSDVRYLKAPRVAMPFGSGVRSSSVGEVWYWFDQVIDYPLTRFRADRFSTLDLDEYDVLILPSSAPDMLNDEGQKKIKTWVRGGGRLIAIGSGANALAGKDGFSLIMKKPDEVADSTAVLIARNRRYGDRNRDRATTTNPGAIYRVQVDNSHPLGFGFDDESFVLRSRSDHPAIMTEDNNWNVGVIEEDARVSGHTGFKAEQRIEGSLAFGVQRMGRGSVVYLLDNPLYRGFWYSGRMLFANAVFMVGQ